MKLIHYFNNNSNHIGVILNDKIYKTKYKDLEELYDVDLNKIETGEEEKESFKELPIIVYPKQDILCLGMNYRDHKEECLKAGFDHDKNEVSVYFSKRCNKAITNDEYINLHSDLTNQADYEGELGVILKKDIYKAKSDKEIENAIFGYCIINDVSARDLQKEHQQFHFGKSLDSYTSISSTFVTVDEIGIRPELELKTYVNDELRQHSNTSLMIFDIPYCIKELTKGITLERGTIISTGTPSGIGKTLGKFLKDGDIVRIEIDCIGKLTNECRG